MRRHKSRAAEEEMAIRDARDGRRRERESKREKESERELEVKYLKQQRLPLPLRLTVASDGPLFSSHWTATNGRETKAFGCVGEDLKRNSADQ